jgi:hypothetical protein
VVFSAAAAAVPVVAIKGVVDIGKEKEGVTGGNGVDVNEAKEEVVEDFKGARGDWM